MSSGFSYPQPIFASPIYNPAFYLTLDASGFLTYDYAQTLYLSKNDYRLTYLTGITQGVATTGVALVPGTGGDISGIGALACSSLTVNGSAITATPSYCLGITPGTADISKALVLNSTKDISGINSLSATTLTGTLSTAAQTNITSLGTLTSLTINGNLSFSGASRSITGLNSLSVTSLTAGTISATTIQQGGTSYTLSSMLTTSTSSITLSGTLTAGTVDATTLKIGGTSITATASELSILSGVTASNVELNYSSGITLGIGSSNKAMTLDSTGDFYSVDTGTNFSTKRIFANVLNSDITSGSPAHLYVRGSSSHVSGSWYRCARFDSTRSRTAGQTTSHFDIYLYNQNANSNNTNGVWLGNSTNDPIRIGVNDITVLYLNSSGRIGVGSQTSPEATIHANGMIWCNEYFHSKYGTDGKAIYRFNWSQANYPAMGTDSTIGNIRLGICDGNFNWVSYVPVRGGAYTNASDIRLKTDIEECPHGLEAVMAMKPRKYRMRQEQTLHVGFIAQELVDIIPEAVEIGANDDLNEAGLPINGWGVDLASLTSVLCKAIQEQQSQIEELKAKINYL